MIPIEILEKIRRINITTSRLATNVFAGDYKSVFKGRGLEFHEVREYVVGDDVRTILAAIEAAGLRIVSRG